MCKAMAWAQGLGQLRLLKAWGLGLDFLRPLSGWAKPSRARTSLASKSASTELVLS